MSKFVVSVRKDGEYQFVLKAWNGEVILKSEGYSAKSGCENGIESVRVNSQDDNRYDRKLSSNGKSYFNLKALNGQVVGNSEMYESATGMEGGIASVMKNAPEAEVEEGE